MNIFSHLSGGAIASLCNRFRSLFQGNGLLQPSEQESADGLRTVSPGSICRIPGQGRGSSPEKTDLTVPAGNTGKITEQNGPISVSGRDTTGRWVITTHRAASFEKVGRIVLDRGDLVLRTDNDHREFSIARRDVEAALSGGTGEVRLPGTAESVGTARMSSSGRALNMVIDGKLHTVPLKLLVLVVEGKRRKVALFAGV